MRRLGLPGRSPRALRHAALIGAFALAGVAGCGDDSEAADPSARTAEATALVGTWEMVQQAESGPATTTLIFASDNRVSYQVVTATGGLKQVGTFMTTGSQLTMRFDTCAKLDANGSESPAPCMNTENVYEFSVQSDTLTLVTMLDGTPTTATVVLTRR